MELLPSFFVVVVKLASFVFATFADAASTISPLSAAAVAVNALPRPASTSPVLAFLILTKSANSTTPLLSAAPMATSIAAAFSVMPLTVFILPAAVIVPLGFKGIFKVVILSN